MVRLLLGMAIVVMLGVREGRLFAQQPRSQNRASTALYAELLGSGLFFSINYEHRMDQALAFRVGGLYGGEKAYWGFVQALGLESLAPSHHLEYGGGIGIIGVEFTLWGYSSSGPAKPHVYFPLHVGYRFQPSDGGLVFRLGFTPIVIIGENKTGLLPWGGLSLGWSW